MGPAVGGFVGLGLGSSLGELDTDGDKLPSIVEGYYSKRIHLGLIITSYDIQRPDCYQKVIV